MIEYVSPKDAGIEYRIPVKKICDKCKKKFDKKDDVFEYQEFHHIRIRGGYNSVWNDGDIIECDLCQHCLHDLIKDFMRRKSEEYI
jgi:hypothetical protein